MNKKAKKEKAITLIALVITIIILLILAGISISSLTGSGLFEKAKEAKNKSEEAQELENSLLYGYEKEIIKESLKNIDYSKTNPVDAMPRDITIIEGDANKGIVIKDNKNNEWTWVEVPKTIFVNVKALEENAPDKDLNKVSVTELYNAIETDLINYVTAPTNYRDSDYKDEWYALDGSTLVNESTANLTEEQKLLNNGCGLTYYEYKENYEKMLSSTFANGGFWISRYEIGDATATASNTTRIETSGIKGEAVSKIDQIPYNFITCSEAQILANSMNSDVNKTTSLLFGIQWDLTCKFIDTKVGNIITKTNCKDWGNYSNSSLILNSGKYNTSIYDSENIWKSFDEDTENYVTSSQTSNNVSYGQLLTTGASEQTNKMNIYDLAGNEFEWTLEQLTSNSDLPCTRRGGCFFSDSSIHPASHHNCYSTSHSVVGVGARATLY